MSKLNCGIWMVYACGVLLLCTAMTASGQTLKTLHSFDGTDGETPAAPLLQATNGNLYGTTEFGGSGSCIDSCGTVFKITPGGKLTTLHNFDETDGYAPEGALIQATNGNLYGTTVGGGMGGSCQIDGGCGTVFKITPNGVLTTIYSFCSLINCADGDGPRAGLVQGTDGAFYGTTQAGGNNDSEICSLDPGCGTVFKITPNGALTILHSFDGTDGYRPYAGLIQGVDGSFYGTTGYGANSAGTIFSITAQGALTTLYSFEGTDGATPLHTLVQGADGNFYGTTYGGGTIGNGTIFKITPSGALTTLHSFTGTDGANPSGLIQATDGNFYGTTENGSPKHWGTAFSITPGGVLTTLHVFQCSPANCLDGTHPLTGVIQGVNGTFYGTTDSGGVHRDYGTVFSLFINLGSKSH